VASILEYGNIFLSLFREGTSFLRGDFFFLVSVYAEENGKLTRPIRQRVTTD